MTEINSEYERGFKDGLKSECLKELKPIMTALAKGCTEAIKGIPQMLIDKAQLTIMQPVNRWIPCSERLPVLYVPVMILTDDGSYAIAHGTENEDEYFWFGDGGHYSKDYVLFWMPLPEPPESEVQKNAIT